MPDLYIAKVFQVEAMQFRLDPDGGPGNLAEVAQWTKGNGFWNYDPKNDQTKAYVALSINEDLDVRVYDTDWVVRQPSENGFLVSSDEEFNKSFMLNTLVRKEICDYCLADIRNTQMSDRDKKCPKCSSGYNGVARTDEYNLLVAAGAVSNG